MTLHHRIALGLAASLRRLPRPLRWPALLAASAAAAPFMRHAMARQEPGMGIDGFREVALWRLMIAAAEAGLTFDPMLDHRGLPDLGAYRKAGRGALIVAPHSLLSYLAVSYLHDLGFDPVVVSADPTIPVLGTRAAPRGIAASPTLLAEAVRHLRAGDFVCAMIDRAEPAKGTFEVPTDLGPVHIAEPMLKFALDAGAEIMFCMIRVSGMRAIATWGAVSRPATLASVKRDFAAFVQSRIREGHGRGGPRHLARRAAEMAPTQR